MRRRGIGTTFAKLTLLVLSLLLVAGVFEVGLRLAGYQAIYDVYSKPSAFWEPDALLGWRHVGGAEGTYVGPRPWPIEFETPIRINSLGLRGPEIPAASPEEQRILFLGDSMVAAFEVEYDDSFVHRIAEEMTRRLDAPVRGINAGVRGYGTDQSLLYFRERGYALEPDVVVFFHSRNDLKNNRTIHSMRRPMGKPAFVATDDGLALVGSPTPTYPTCSEYVVSSEGRVQRIDGVVGRVVCHLQLVLLDHSALFSFLTLRIPWNADLLRNLYYLGFAQKPEDKAQRVSDRPIAGLTRSLIAELGREAERRGAGFLVVGEKEILRELGGDLLEAQGVEVIELDDLGELPETHFQNDSHYTALGHERVTERLAPRLEELLRARREGAPPAAVDDGRPAERLED